MSRLFRPMGSLLKMSRLSRPVSNTQTITLQKIKIGPPPRGGSGIQRIVMAGRRIAGIGLVAFGCYSIYATLVLVPLLRALEDAVEAVPETKDDEEAEDTILFLPLPLTTTKLDPQPYSGKDPEWLEFVRIAKDKELQKDVRTDITNMALDAALGSTLLTAKCGKDLRLRRSWIDLDYPYMAPPEYEQFGILVTPDIIAYASRPVDSATAQMTERALWPKPVALATWALTTTLVKESASDVARFFGLDINLSTQTPSSPTPSSSPGPLPTSSTGQSAEIQKALQRIRQQATKRPEEVKDPSALASAAQESPSDASSPSAAAAPSSPGPGDKKAGQQPRNESLIDESKVRSLLGSAALTAFYKKLAENWKPIREDPPRGCIAVSGLVELETSKSWVVLDVFGWYNPKTKSVDKKSMWVALRRLQHKRQAPIR
ncbi:hypothetical protein B0T22DRAFT_525771 [Podospora appendiculata]|uniref:Uncharacterized protein n=1 Tax=Podospora appendiculata TaxID=314037 RepID=A0AAE1CGL2_9PEZI|nr:hypothetical protein B0T22DRAFT_525771 [Podospora appendiculata]